MLMFTERRTRTIVLLALLVAVLLGAGIAATTMHKPTAQDAGPVVVSAVQIENFLDSDIQQQTGFHVTTSCNSGLDQAGFTTYCVVVDDYYQVHSVKVTMTGVDQGFTYSVIPHSNLNAAPAADPAAGE